MKETVRIIRFIIVGTLNAVIAALVVWVLMHGRTDKQLPLVQVLDFSFGQGNKKEQHPASDTVLSYSFCHGLQRPVCVPSCIGGTSSSQ